MKSRDSILVGALLATLISVTIVLSALLSEEEEDPGLLSVHSAQGSQGESSLGPTRDTSSEIFDDRVTAPDERSGSDAPEDNSSHQTFRFVSATPGMAISAPTSWEIVSTLRPLTSSILTTDEQGVATCSAAFGTQEWRVKSQSADWVALTKSFRANHPFTVEILIARQGLGRIKVVDAAHVPISGALVSLMDGTYADLGDAPFDSGLFGIERQTGADGVAEFEMLIDPLACAVSVSREGYAPVVGCFPSAFDVTGDGLVAEAQIMLEGLSLEASQSVRFDVQGTSSASRWTLLATWPNQDMPIGWSNASNMGSAPLGQAVAFPRALPLVRKWSLATRLAGAHMSVDVISPQATEERLFDIILKGLTRCTFRLPAEIAKGVGIRYIDTTCSGQFLNLETEAYAGVWSDLSNGSSERSVSFELPSGANASIVANLTDGRAATAKIFVPNQEADFLLEGPEFHGGESLTIRVVCNNPLAPTAEAYVPPSSQQWDVAGGPEMWTIEGVAPLKSLWLRVLDGLYIVVRETGEPGTLADGIDLSHIRCEETQLRFQDSSGQVLSGLEFSLSPASHIDHDSAEVFQWRPSGSPGYEVRLQTGPRFHTGKDGVATVRLPVGEYRVYVSGSSEGRMVYPSRTILRPARGVVDIVTGGSQTDLTVEAVREVTIQVRSAGGRSLDVLNWSLFGAESGTRREFYGPRGSFRWTEQSAHLGLRVTAVDDEYPIHVPEGADPITLQVTIP